LANQRNIRNFIYEIRDANGDLQKTPESVGAAFTHFFQGLYTTEGTRGFVQVVDLVPSRVTQSMNEMLTKAYSEEIDISLSQMHPLKALRPDGFGVCFYQKHWATVGAGVRTAVLYFLNSGIFYSSLNLTYIALIPKLQNVVCVSDFRAISLCNVLYKIVAKVLANRLKQVLGDIISPQQSTFVPGRLIMDNVIVAYEALHTMSTRIKGKKGYMAIKLDMSKAYDRVDGTIWKQ